MKTSKLNIALVSPNYNRYSETFIKAHKDFLDGNIFYYYGDNLPHSLEGHGQITPEGRRSLKDRRRARKMIRESFEKNNINLVFAEYGQTGVNLLPICDTLDIPIITHFHGYDASRYDVIKKYRHRYKELFDYRYSKIIGVSNHMKANLMELGCPKDKLEFNPYGPREDFLKTDRTYKQKQFVSIGRFTPKKAPLTTIKAFQQLVEKHSDALLLMGGEGELLQKAQNYVIANELENNIKFLGSLDHDQVVKIFSESYCFVQHSIQAQNGDCEGTPVAILEASAASLPIVSTRHAGIIDVVIEEMTGLLCDEGNLDEMAHNLIRIYENEELANKLGNNARQRIQDHYTLEKHITKHNEIITSLNDYHKKVSPIFRNDPQLKKDEAFDIISSLVLKEDIDKINSPFKFSYLDSKVEVVKDMPAFNPFNINEEDDDVIDPTLNITAFCLYKNGADYMSEFIEHHQKIGICKIVLLDNNSDDNSIEIALKYDNVYVYKTELPFKKYSLALRQYLVNKFGMDKWCLVLDIDEFFDYPYSSVISAYDLVQYLTHYKYTAVMSQMIDLFPKGNLLEQEDFSDFRNKHIYYETESIVKNDYWLSNKNNLSNKSIKIFRGGIRDRVFGLNSLLLSKHPLFFNSTQVKYNHIHWVEGAKVADFSTVLLHYKFHPSFKDHVKKAVEEESYYSESRDYKSYLQKISENNFIELYSDLYSKAFTRTNHFITQNIIRVSKEYLDFAIKVVEPDDLDAQKMPDLIDLLHDQKASYKYLLKKVQNENSVKKLKKEIQAKDNKIKWLRNLNSEIYKSVSYRIGNFFMKPLSKILNR